MKHAQKSPAARPASGTSAKRAAPSDARESQQAKKSGPQSGHLNKAVSTKTANSRTEKGTGEASDNH